MAAKERKLPKEKHKRVVYWLDWVTNAIQVAMGQFRKLGGAVDYEKIQVQLVRVEGHLKSLWDVVGRPKSAWYCPYCGHVLITTDNVEVLKSRGVDLPVFREEEESGFEAVICPNCDSQVGTVEY